jgi:hypothetical protein
VQSFLGGTHGIMGFRVGSHRAGGVPTHGLAHGGALHHVLVMVLASHTRHCYVCDVGSRFHLRVTHDMFSHHLVEGLADHVS